MISRNIAIGILTAAVILLAVLLLRAHRRESSPDATAAAVAVEAASVPGRQPGEAASPGQPPAEASSLCRELLGATISGDYATFKRVCETRGESNMRAVASDPATEATFRRASRTIATPCWGGYDMQYLGELSQKGGHRIFLWKLVPKAGQDQFLVRLTLKEGRLAGFFFQ